MSALEDIRHKLSYMKDRRCHEDFYKLADNLIETDSYDMLPVLLNIINKYDSVTRYKAGLEAKLENFGRKYERLANGYTYTTGGGKK